MPKRSAKAVSHPKSKRKSYVLALTACSSRREAKRIARSLVAARLAACVNISNAPLRSIYRWKSKIEETNEFLLLIKTSQSHLAALQAEVLRLHSYKVPEFLVLPVSAGSPAYLAWLDNCLHIS